MRMYRALEAVGVIAGAVVAWSGDGNNVAASWIHAAVRFPTPDGGFINAELQFHPAAMVEPA